MAEPVVVYPFKYFDELRKRWVQARYKATEADIAARYTKWQITGPGERREGEAGFQPPTV